VLRVLDNAGLKRFRLIEGTLIKVLPEENIVVKEGIGGT
jgi:hypothetical protein